MSFRYHVLDLKAMTCAPKDHPEKEKLNALRSEIIKRWHEMRKQTQIKIVIEGIEYELKQSEYQPNRKGDE